MQSLTNHIDWQSLSAFGVVLVILVFLVYWIVKQFIKFLERRESHVINREEKLLVLMDKQADAITSHTKTMASIQENLRADRQSVEKQIKRSEGNIKRAIKNAKG